MSTTEYIYTYTWHKDEYDLSRMEMRSFFGFDVPLNALKSSVQIDPSRSPFIKQRLEVIFEGENVEQLARLVEQLDLGGATFKVSCLNKLELNSTQKIGHSKRNEIERTIGLCIQGEPDLIHPQLDFGVVTLDDKWYFGKLELNEAVWLQHQQKPEMYSTALSTRVARAVANIAVPNPEGFRVIDPCCGIGTVLVEALSMGIDIEGRDINPLVVYGSRKNIAHFGLQGNVTIGPIEEAEGNYDVAIIDMPYNLFTHITADSQQAIITEARRITKKIVIVTIDTIDHMIEAAGFEILDRCVAKKGTFERQILFCN
ncbi:TRM11 family SAM-dependent methyltransferase [Solibacillus sp. FSL H8-0538]|uniref:TRM11 family SAM-dependent methyltransferase n=1 Tax=Solibacillus sp. FSL H8-0538 TaxID=2921400 RepID=UPI0030FCB66F